MPRKKKTARRLKGTGSAYWSKARGAYVVKVIVGRYPSGKPKYSQVQGATATAARDRAARVGPPDPGVTVAAWLDRWLDEMVCKPATRRNRTAAARHHLKPALGHLTVAALTPRQIEVAATRFRTVRRGAVVPLSPNTAWEVVNILSTALRAAVRAGLRTDNPVDAAPRPKRTRQKLDPFTVDELGRICAEAERRPNTRVVALLAATGMRAGEALALDVTDYDRARHAVSVTKTLDVSDCRVRGTPKSENGVRTVVVSPDPPAARRAVAAAAGARTAGPLFRTASGRRTVYRVLRVAWAALLGRLGIRYRGPHQLRHAFASHALAAGCTDEDVARHLGDTPLEVKKTYSHATGRTDPAERFAGLFRESRSDGGATDPPAKPAAAGKSRAKGRK